MRFFVPHDVQVLLDELHFTYVKKTDLVFKLKNKEGWQLTIYRRGGGCISGEFRDRCYVELQILDPEGNDTSQDLFPWVITTVEAFKQVLERNGLDALAMLRRYRLQALLSE